MTLYENPHPPGCPWSAAADLFGAPNVKWCEETVCSLVSEPANTWSNLPLILVGARLVLATERSLRQLGWAVVAMGALSFAYHLSNNFLSQVLDFLGMFITLSVIATANMSRLRWLTSTQRLIVGNALWVGSTMAIWPLYRSGFPYQALVFVLALGAVALETFATVRLRYASRRYLVLTTLAFVVAGACTALDRRLCLPSQHVLHGHGLWHVFAAGGFWLLAKHWRAQGDAISS